jgi:hypothetical protein
MENPKVQENYEKAMKSFDKLDASFERTTRAIYFLYGGAVALLVYTIIEVFENV